MFIRNRLTQVDFLGNEGYSEVAGRTNLYPTAFPFKSAQNGRPYPVAFVAIHGMAPAVTTLTDIWGQNIVRTMPSNGFTIAVSSSSTNDVNTSGSGAWRVEVDILDIEYIPHTLTFNLNGQNKVTDTSYVAGCIRINDARVVSVGSSAVNAGDIYVYDDSSVVSLGVPQSATKIFHRIMSGDMVGRGAFYTVPKSCKLQTQQVRAGITDAQSTNRYGSIQLNTKSFMGTSLVSRIFPITGQISSGMGLVEISPDFPLIFPEKTDLCVQAQCSGSAVVAVYMDAVLFYA